MLTITSCPCCGGVTFTQNDILWSGLIKEWKLTPKETAAVNRQQGYMCDTCGSNLRSMTLAAAIMRCQQFKGTLKQFTAKRSRLKVLEVNEAGHLNPFLRTMKGHMLATYPEVDIQNLPYSDASFDMVVHSDTLEHVVDPVTALRESWRVLKPGGFTCYTIPAVIGRNSAHRKGKKPSFHGTPGEVEYLVYTEYGHDMWTQVMEAGFAECRLVSLDFPASVAIIGVK